MTDRYKSYEGTVDDTTPVTLNVYTDIKGTAQGGYIAADNGDIKVSFGSDNPQITVKAGEALAIEGLEASKIVLIAASGTANYRCLVHR